MMTTTADTSCTTSGMATTRIRQRRRTIVNNASSSKCRKVFPITHYALVLLSFLILQSATSTTSAASASPTTRLRGGGGGGTSRGHQAPQAKGLPELESESEAGRQQAVGGQRQLQSRIVGGSAVRAGAHPYFAQWEGALCGGAVIHDDIVISAAHCFDPMNPPASRRLYLNSVYRSQGVQARYVHLEVHPQYNSTVSKEYDFVLIKTSNSMLDDGTGPTGVQTIPINRDPRIPEDDRPVLAVGYGQRTEHDFTLSPILMDVLLYYVNSQTCANQYVERGKYNNDVMFCTGVPGGGKDTCTGDSGGPLVDYRTRTLVGLVSWGEGCAREDYSGVNARISAVVEWIDQKICELSKFRPATCPSKVPPVSNAQEPEDGGGGGTGSGDSGGEGSSSSTTPGGSGGGRPGGRPGGSGGPGGGGGSIQFPGSVDVGRDSPPGGDGGGGDGADSSSSSTNSNSNGSPPLYNPPSTLASNNGVGGSSNANYAMIYPGDSPKQPKNAVMINILYNAHSQQVRWSLDYEDPDDNWVPLFTSPRGRAGTLSSEAFLQLFPGWYRFQLDDNRASSSMDARDYSLQWMSIMAPRGVEIWGKNDRFTQEQYNIYFEVGTNGIPSLGSRPDLTFLPP